jgi:hypothetical protein
VFKAIIEHFHGPGFDGPYEHVVADRLQAISAGSFLGKWPGDDGLKGKEGPELSWQASYSPRSCREKCTRSGSIA